ncbi:hypothetical protein EON64_12185 [archaeon]|nr:MAG: hypothetical protein EON64_12185 [archaeon]
MPLLGEEEQHLVSEVRADPTYIQGIVTLLLAVDDPHLLHTGLTRVLDENNHVAFVCARHERGGDERLAPPLSVSSPLEALKKLSQNVEEAMTSTGTTSSTVGSANSTSNAGSMAFKRRPKRLQSSCHEEFLRRGKDCLVLKLKY